MPNDQAPREDFLEEDPEISGQKFCLLSFLSPEKVLNNKNLFFFNKFLGTYDRGQRVQCMEKYLVDTVTSINNKLDKEVTRLLIADLSGAADICRQSKLQLDTVVDEYQTFVKNSEKEISESKLKDMYDEFLYANKDKLEDEFFTKNDFRTTVRGLKVRGVYGSQAEAVARSKKLQRNDTLHNIFVGEIGKWLPWDPEPNDVADQEYAEDQLNTLMKKYKENDEARETFNRDQRKRDQAKRTMTMDGASADETVGAVGAVGTLPVAPIVPGGSTTVDADSYGGMFGSVGHPDLAIARKQGSE